MANQELYDKTYKIPSEVLKGIQTYLVSNPNGNGVKRAKHILRNGYLTYQALKRLKNFFDHFNSEINDNTQFYLAGGQPMKEFIETTLNQERAGVNRSKEVKRDMTANPNSELMPHQTPRLNEVKKKKVKNAVAVIVNKDNKILLLKRSDTPKVWMPNKWSLVGGKVEKSESPEQGCKREILEETGLEIKKFVKSFTIERNTDSIEYIYACRYEGDDTDIVLDRENTNYGWYDVSEMEFLDLVPHLIEYITLVFKKYE